MTAKSLSVLMANYNHARFLPRSLSALVSQSRPPDEIIVVDDGSTDNSVAIIEDFASRHPVIRLLRNESNLGSFTSVARARAAATGQHLYSASADDEVLPGFFEQAMAMAEKHPRAGVVFGNMVIVDSHGKKQNTIGVSAWDKACYVPPEAFLTEYMDRELPSHSLSGTTIYKRSAFDGIGGMREELLSWRDTFLYRCLSLRHGACYVPKRFLLWHRRTDSMSGRTGSNPRLQLDIIARAMYLMRSAPYRDLFPESHVRNWGRAYRRMSIKEALVRRRGSASSRRELIKTLMLEPFFWALLSLYRGDLSCFDEKP